MEKIVLPERKNIRYSGYDYSQCGMYYVTLCTSAKSNVFGELLPVYDSLNGIITDVDMIKTPIAEYVGKIWSNIPDIYPYIETDAFTIMPDHIHGILIWKYGYSGTKTLGQVVSAFKSITSREYMRMTAGKTPLWQRNYYDTIVTYEKQYDKIVEYIENNRLSRVLKQENKINAPF